MTSNATPTSTGVLIIVENLPCPFDSRVWQQAMALRKAGYTVSIICPKGKGFNKSFEMLENIAIYRHESPIEARGALGYLVEYSWALVCEFWLSVKVLRQRGFDVIHACNPPDTIFLVGAFYKLFGKKFIFDHHDANPELYEAKFERKSGLFYRLLVALERVTFRTADISIATNESYKSIALKRGGMPPEDVFVVRSGPELNRIFTVDPDPSLLNGRKHLVGYVGVMGKQDGIDYLIRAAHHIVFEIDRHDIQFCLVGGGSELAMLRDYAREQGVDDYVTFTGRVSDADLRVVLSTSDICVNSDVVNEMNNISTMNKVMEYMALGKPVVQFDLKEGRVSAQDASAYVKPNDVEDMAVTICKLLDDPDARLRMGRIGRERIESKLAWKHQAQHLLAAYDKVLETQS